MSQIRIGTDDALETETTASEMHHDIPQSSA